ncbi:Prephenate dehydratase [Russula earlei]|uniref:Prephenate dehydratase n=1 Tax=Russula earlei TaxID=71964 RepID=A0ACC0TQV9_9AGAM|nr:Prephenate dehydratase [Russula earlei]
MENTSNQSPLSLPEGIAIQGYEGSFHQVAAQQYFGKQVPVICCATFREVVKIAANKKESGGGMMAIENSIAGSILPNYTLLEKSGLKVTGEVYLPIKQHLLVNPGVTLDQVKEVHSHHMAIQQCMEYLDKYDWKLVETEDTALSAKHVHQHRSKHIAAIASKLAAELFELEVLVPNIHTQKSNYTRFLVLQREVTDEIVETANKASVNFETDHTKGSLVKALNVIADGGINLSKLQSMPIAGTNFKYSFHADMEFETMEQFHTVIDKMGGVTQQIKIYGVYRNGNIAG